MATTERKAGEMEFATLARFEMSQGGLASGNERGEMAQTGWTTGENRE